MYRIQIDRSLCSGFGSCADLAPEAFEVGPDGIARACVEHSPDDSVIEAAGSCPMGAIAVFAPDGEQVA